MNISALKQTTAPQSYDALTVDTVTAYVSAHKNLAAKLGGEPSQWQVREVGDGNLNLVFIVEGKTDKLCLKQALPYVRLVGESWPLPLSRAHYEYAALTEEARAAPRFVPAIYHHDAPMALTAMEFLSPHIILRKGLIQGITYPSMAAHLGEFLALSLYHTSDYHRTAAAKKKLIADFSGNTAMCKISEDLIFDEPYFKAPMNRHTRGLDDIVAEFQQDAALKLAVQEMKWRFMNHAEALIHGDLHTGSIMVTADDTRAIDPEFAFMGPMGFDVGAILGNLLMSYFSQPGHADISGQRDEYAEWILRQIAVLWQNFADHFRRLIATRDAASDILAPRVMKDHAAALTTAIDARLHAIWDDAIGFAACKMIRRMLGLAHVEDFEAIKNEKMRATCERRVLTCARTMLLVRAARNTPHDLLNLAKKHNQN